MSLVRSTTCPDGDAPALAFREAPRREHLPEWDRGNGVMTPIETVQDNVWPVREERFHGLGVVRSFFHVIPPLAAGRHARP